MNIILALLLGSRLLAVNAEHGSLTTKSTTPSYPRVTEPPIAIRGADWKRQLPASRTATCGFYSQSIPLVCSIALQTCDTQTIIPAPITRTTLGPLPTAQTLVGCCLSNGPCSSATRCVQQLELFDDPRALTCTGEQGRCRTYSWRGINASSFQCVSTSDRGVIEVVPTTTTSEPSTSSRTIPGNTGAPSTGVVTTRPGTSPTNGPGGGGQDAPLSSGLTKEAKIGMGTGLGGGGIIGIGVLYYFFHRRKRDESNVVHSGTDTANGKGGATSRMYTTEELGTTEGTYLPDKQSHVGRIQQV
ncbi:hypothetical protein QBC43DRAFT_112036 [Cladorrhinum sp. PSN259]|nr:hypothetical protein QBC43DRAFT_112036 [Cladorrhinum sp. PSN259]